MALLFSTLIIITCVLLVLIILVQNPKGGGLSSSFGGSGTQVFGGVKKTTDFLDKGTWALSILLVVLVLFANVTLTPKSSDSAAEQEARSTNVQAPETTVPQQPITLPQNAGQNSEMPESVEK